MVDPDRKAVQGQLARAEARLKDLERESAEARARIKALRTKLSSPPSNQVYQVTPPDKLALFRQLFRGREDVFARLWVNPKKQIKGYAPACANEWIRGVCEKPRVKCRECPNQEFLPYDDKAILSHLPGHHVIGVYPLLADETCWFLAVDFDGSAWREDVAAFWKGTLVQYTGGVPMLVKMFEKRQRAYRAIGYEEEWAPGELRVAL